MALLVILIATCVVQCSPESDGGVTVGPYEADEKLLDDEENGSYVAPSVPSALFLENFNEDPFTSNKWVKSSDPKYANQQVSWAEATGNVKAFKGDRGLLLQNPGQHYGIASRITPAIDNENKDLVIQYEVKFDSRLSCGGAYIKLLDDAKVDELSNLNNDSPYIIMFGPDHCGSTNKVHFIFRHYNPKSETWEEKHLTDAPAIKNDELSHIYTLIIRKDNTFEIKIDQETARKGSLLSDFSPAVVPEKEIDDPQDKKPADWVDEEFIDEPGATKPEDWDETLPEYIPDPEDKMPEDWLVDEPTMIPDPEAVKPAEWNEEEDGAWEAPLIRNKKCDESGCGKWEPRLIKNPAYKGKWVPPKVKNPAYIGVWQPKKIPNPHYFEDKQPSNLSGKIGAIFIEIWTMQQNSFFDNILITHDADAADEFATKTWAKKHVIEKQKLAKTNEKADTSDFIQNLVTKAQELVKEYPLYVIGGTILTLIISTIPICLMFGGSDEEKLLPKAKPAESKKEEEKEEKEEEIKEESENKDE